MTASPTAAVDAVLLAPMERASLAWRVRNILARGDQVAAAWLSQGHIGLAAIARVEYTREELLRLLVELEGGARP